MNQENTVASKKSSDGNKIGKLSRLGLLVRLSQPVLIYYAFPLLTVVLVTFFRISIFGLQSGPAFLPFFIAVIVSTWYGNFQSGIISTILAALVANYLFLPPFYVFNLDLLALIQTGIFIVEGTFLTFIIETRRRTQRQLEIELRRVIHILESISDVFIVTNKHWRITYMNSQAQHFFKKNQDQLMGKNLWSEFPISKGSNFYKKCHQSLSKMTPLKFEQHLTNVDEKEKWLEVHTYPSYDGLNVYISEITERKEVESLKDNFISIASHELRTPSTTIQGFAQLLDNYLKKGQDSKAKMYSEQIITQASRMISLLQMLLDVSRLQTGKLELIKEQLNLNDVIKNAIKIVQPTTDSHKIFFKEDQSYQLIWADNDRIEQVLVNLLTNAIKYSPRAKKVIVNLSFDPRGAVISVTDFGIGISSNQLRKVFDRYYRISHSSTVSVKGIGLGLYIASEIIKQHKGKIWVESEENKGSIFYFTLPI